jgi:hypothetical protein
MRLLRALAHLVLALALIGVAAAPVRAGLVSPVPEKPHVHASIDDHDHAVGHASAAHHDHAMPAGEQPSHPSDGCVTACCFIPSQLPPRAPGASAVEFFCAVRYADAANAASGRVDAPEPGIPKAP